MRRIVCCATVAVLAAMVFAAQPGKTIPWQPVPLIHEDVAPPATVRHEMIDGLTIAGWPIVLEKTSLRAARQRFGGTIGQTGDAGGYLEWLCVEVNNPSDSSVLWLTASEINGGRIDGLLWRNLEPYQHADLRCKTLSGPHANIELHKPIQLGMSISTVEKTLGVPSKRQGNLAQYFYEGKTRIDGIPYTTGNSVNLCYRDGRVHEIEVSKTTTN